MPKTRFLELGQRNLGFYRRRNRVFYLPSVTDRYFMIHRLKVVITLLKMANVALISGNENNSRIARIGNLLESLREKIKNFTVLDRQGQVVGEVRDLIIDGQRQLNFVVCKSEPLEIEPLFVLSSKFVEKIDSHVKCIFINVEKSKINYLYKNKPARTIQGSKMEQNSNSLEANTQGTAPIIEEATSINGENSVDEIIRLLGERLIIDRSKRKVGEVIVRKKIETRMVQVPIRSEKLIVEQVSPEYKQLAEIDLRQGEISADVELIGEIPNSEINSEIDEINGNLTVSGEFSSPKIASLILNAIALERNHGCKAVRVTVIVEDEERQELYREWFSRTSKSSNV